MTLFGDPETHAANPPETWTIERCKYSPRRPPLWYVTTASGGRLSSAYGTRKAAEEELAGGWLPSLWHREARWYAGEHVTGWKTWAECKAEQERTHARNVTRALMRMVA